ncbi:MAG: hypothetical protein ACLFSV_09215, partial [Alkalispirochaeta sp.]
MGLVAVGGVWGAAPDITDVSIPNDPMNVGDVVVATITVTSDPNSFSLTSGDIAGYPVGNLNKNSDTEYTVDFTITDGGTDYAAGDDIPVTDLQLNDGGTLGNIWNTPISQGGDPIDANNPAAFTTGAVVTTGGTVVTDYWNGTNTGVEVTIPIDNDASLDGGTVQLEADASGGGFAAVGAAENIAAGDLGNSVTASASDTDIEALGGFGEGDTLTFRAVITDAAGNSTTGADSGDTLTVDQTAPAVSSITSGTADGAYNEPDNIDVTVNFDENVTLVGGTLDVELDTGVTLNIGAFGPAGSVTETYTISAGENSGDLTVTSDPLTLSGGTLRDAAGNDATLAIPGGQNLGDNANLVIDTTAPVGFTTGAVVTTGGTVVADYWNGTNTGVEVTIPIDNDTSLDGGTVQLEADASGGGFAAVGAAENI